MLQLVQTILSGALLALWQALQQHSISLRATSGSLHDAAMPGVTINESIAPQAAASVQSLLFSIISKLVSAAIQQRTLTRKICNLRACMRRAGWHSLSVEYYRGDTVQPLPTLTLSMRSSPDDADAAFWPIDTRLFRVRPLGSRVQGHVMWCHCGRGDRIAGEYVSVMICMQSWGSIQHAATYGCSE
jgi:hypothetical protein